MRPWVILYIAYKSSRSQPKWILEFYFRKKDGFKGTGDKLVRNILCIVLIVDNYIIGRCCQCPVHV